MIIIQFNGFAYLAEGEHYMNEKQYLRANKRVFLAVTIIFAYITLTMLAALAANHGDHFVRIVIQCLVSVGVIIISALGYLTRKETHTCAIILTTAMMVGYAAVALLNTTEGTWAYALPLVIAAMVYQDFTELKKILSASAANTYDMDKIEKAYKFAEKAHGDQRRVSGIPYILHPVSVACIVAELGMDTDSVCGALLHDTVEDTGVTLEEVTKLFGADVAKLIDGVTKISKIPYSTREQQQAENIRKMLIAMADDIRVIIIKLADRLHNMRTMNCMPEHPEKRHR